MHTHYCPKCRHAFFCTLPKSQCFAPNYAEHADPCPNKAKALGWRDNVHRVKQPTFAGA